MHLCIEGSIKISYREIEMFHLPSHGIALIRLVPLGSHQVGAPWGGTLSTTLNVPWKYICLCAVALDASKNVFLQCGLRRFPREEFR